MSFNCKTTCKGVYAGVEWNNEIVNSEGDDGLGVENKVEPESYKDMYERMKEDFKKEMRLMKGSTDQKEEALDKKKYMRLVSEYKKFKRNASRNFRFKSDANLTSFGEFQSKAIPYMKLQERSCQSQPCSWFRSTLTRRPSTTSRETRRSRRRPS